MNNSDILSIVALLISLCTLFIEYLSVKQSKDMTLYQKVTQSFLDINQMFLQFPELRPFFYDRVEQTGLESEELQQRLLMASEILLDHFEWILHDIKFSNLVDQESWLAYIYDTYQNSPTLISYHQQHISWHPLFNNFLLTRKN